MRARRKPQSQPPKSKSRSYRPEKYEKLLLQQIGMVEKAHLVYSNPSAVRDCDDCDDGDMKSELFQAHGGSFDREPETGGGAVVASQSGAGS